MSKPQKAKLPSIPQAQQVHLPKVSSTHYITLHRVKQVCGWFPTWLPWQRRVFVCQLMEHCSREQLELLATSLEPILHLDFSTSLGPHLQALHLDRAATFHVQRTLVQNVLNPLPSITSWACLESLPLTMTSSDGDSLVRRQPSPKLKETKREEQGVILPALPLTHLHHEQSRSIEDIVTLRRQRFGSIPDFRSTASLLKNVRRKDQLVRAPPRNHKRSKSLSGHSSEDIRQAESFKKQLIGLSKWMDGWESTQRAYLLLEVVKICDKDLLGYFVQCLHQRLHDSVGMDVLSDGILIKIFSYLTPLALCRAAQTCKRWNRLACQPSLWKAQCQSLSTREGVSDLSKAVEVASGQPLNEDNQLDWKKTYRDLSSVMTRVKELVLKAARTEGQTGSVLEGSSKNNSVAIMNNYSLKQMLQILRDHSASGSRPPTTQELLLCAPESPASTRRRQRAERMEAYLENERLEMERLMSARYHHRKPKDRSQMQSPELGRSLLNQHIETWRSRVTESDNIQLVDVAIDTRPGVPALPNPEGIECLVLSGGLTGRLKPGKVQPIPRLRRLQHFFSAIQCLQCDQKKIVAGTAGREILVRDFRTGRPVKVLTGHKGSVQCLQYDCYKIVSGSWDTTCIVWDAVHFEPLKELRGHTNCVSCLQFNEDYLVTGSHDKSLRVWSTSTWDCVTVIGDAHTGPILCMQFNDRVIASGSTDKTVRLWSSTTHHLLHTLKHKSPVCSLHLANVLLITASLTGGILLWNVVSGTLLLEMSKVKGACMVGLAFASERVYGAGSDGVLYEWDICSGTCVRTLTGHSSRLNCVWAGNDKIVTAADDKTLCVWYTKKAVVKELVGDELVCEETEAFYTELPIRVVTENEQIS